MMDATFTAVVRLWEQGLCQTEIARRLNLSDAKTRKVLLTVGLIATEESRLYAQGMSVDAIAAKLRKTRNAVLCRLPYEKGLYGAEFPSKNALKIKRCREAKEKNANDE